MEWPLEDIRDIFRRSLPSHDVTQKNRPQIPNKVTMSDQKSMKAKKVRNVM